MVVLGFAVVFFAGIANGCVGLLVRVRRRYVVENTMVVAFLVAAAIPIVAVAALVPEWRPAVTATGWATIATVFAFGLVWGLASTLFVFGISSVGLSLGYALIMGVATVAGSVVPLVRRWATIPGPPRLLICLGVGICVLGVSACGLAGMSRDRSRKTRAGSDDPRRSPWLSAVGVSVCVMSGLFGACINIGFDYADRISAQCISLGTEPALATLVRWPAFYCGGYLVILATCTWNMTRNQTWRRFVDPGTGRDLGLAVLMGLLIFVSQVVYGLGAFWMGELGTSMGWGVLMAVGLLVANGIGISLGEWHGAGRRAFATLCVGMCILVLGTVLLAWVAGWSA